MSHILRLLHISFIIAASLLLSGCIVNDHMSVKFYIEPDLSGSIAIQTTGIHSSEKDPDKKKKEFDKYCKDGYLEDSKKLASAFGLSNPQTTLTNRTDTTCDVILEGSFDNIGQALSSMIDDGDYEIKKTREHFIGRFLMKEQKEDDKDDDNTDSNDYSIVIQYEGETLDHNAHQVDNKSGSMTWNEEDMSEEGVQFILILPVEKD